MKKFIHTVVNTNTRRSIVMWGVLNKHTIELFPDRECLQFVKNSYHFGQAIFNTKERARRWRKDHKLGKDCKIAKVLITPLDTREAIIENPCENCSQREEMSIQERVYRDLKSKRKRVKK